MDGNCGQSCRGPCSTGEQCSSRVGQPGETPKLPNPVEVTVAVRVLDDGDEDSDDGQEQNTQQGRRRGIARRDRFVAGHVRGTFHPDLYLKYQDCITYKGKRIGRSRFEKLGNSSMAKWYRSIRVVQDDGGLEPLGEWLIRHNLPVLKGKQRTSRKRPALMAAAAAATAAAAAASPPLGDAEDDDDGGSDVSAAAAADGSGDEEPRWTTKPYTLGRRCRSRRCIGGHVSDEDDEWVAPPSRTKPPAAAAATTSTSAAAAAAASTSASAAVGRVLPVRRSPVSNGDVPAGGNQSSSGLSAAVQMTAAAMTPVTDAAAVDGGAGGGASYDVACALGAGKDGVQPPSWSQWIDDDDGAGGDEDNAARAMWALFRDGGAAAIDDLDDLDASGAANLAAPCAAAAAAAGTVPLAAAAAAGAPTAAAAGVPTAGTIPGASPVSFMEASCTAYRTAAGSGGSGGGGGAATWWGRAAGPNPLEAAACTAAAAAAATDPSLDVFSGTPFASVQRRHDCVLSSHHPAVVPPPLPEAAAAAVCPILSGCMTDWTTAPERHATWRCNAGSGNGNGNVHGNGNGNGNAQDVSPPFFASRGSGNAPPQLQLGMGATAAAAAVGPTGQQPSQPLPPTPLPQQPMPSSALPTQGSISGVYSGSANAAALFDGRGSAGSCSISLQPMAAAAAPIYVGGAAASTQYAVQQPQRKTCLRALDVTTLSQSRSVPEGGSCDGGVPWVSHPRPPSLGDPSSSESLVCDNEGRPSRLLLQLPQAPFSPPYAPVSAPARKAYSVGGRTAAESPHAATEHVTAAAGGGGGGASAAASAYWPPSDQEGSHMGTHSEAFALAAVAAAPPPHAVAVLPPSANPGPMRRAYYHRAWPPPPSCYPYYPPYHPPYSPYPPYRHHVVPPPPYPYAPVHRASSGVFHHLAADEAAPSAAARSGYRQMPPPPGRWPPQPRVSYYDGGDAATAAAEAGMRIPTAHTHDGASTAAAAAAASPTAGTAAEMSASAAAAAAAAVQAVALQDRNAASDDPMAAAPDCFPTYKPWDVAGRYDGAWPSQQLLPPPLPQQQQQRQLLDSEPWSPESLPLSQLPQRPLHPHQHQTPPSAGRRLLPRTTSMPARTPSGYSAGAVAAGPYALSPHPTFYRGGGAAIVRRSSSGGGAPPADHSTAAMQHLGGAGGGGGTYQPSGPTTPTQGHQPPSQLQWHRSWGSWAVTGHGGAALGLPPPLPATSSAPPPALLRHAASESHLTMPYDVGSHDTVSYDGMPYELM